MVSNPLNPSKKAPAIIEENEAEPQPNIPVPIISKPKISVERLSMSQLDARISQNEQPQKEHSTSSRHPVKVPSHIFTRRSPDSHKNLRAKTVRIGKIRWPPPLNPEEVDSANQQRFESLSSIHPKKIFISRRMLVQRRIQEEIHGNGNKGIQNGKPETNGFHHSPPPPHPKKSSPVERKTPNGRRSQSDERFLHEPPKKSPITKPPVDHPSSFTDDGDDDDDIDEMSTTELVTRNQSSKLDFHKTMTPMIGKENFELRKKLFENPDESSFAGKGLLSLPRFFTESFFFRCSSMSF